MNKSTKFGFTIVELLVVIVVIGILAAITIVAYTGIQQKATAASLQSDLDNSSKRIKLYQAENASGNYPTANNCPNPGATEICIKTSGSNNIDPSTGYTVNNSSNPKTFTLIASNGTIAYQIDQDSAPAVASLSLAITDPANWLAIGTQVWAKYNLNVGTMVTGATEQTNNAVLEKYCYNNTESNCTTYGGLYQWDEAMQYVTTNGAQGICPVGSHFPSDNDLKVLEMQLGMSQVEADATGWRGTDQGTQLKPGGTSGLNIPFAGYRITGGSFDVQSSGALLWSSSESSTSAWSRYLNESTPVVRDSNVKGLGFSVRCLGN